MSADDAVVVGVAGESTGRHVVEWAAAEAHRRRCGLLVLHAVPSRPGAKTRADGMRSAARTTGPRKPESRAVLVERGAADLLSRAAGWARSAEPGLRVHTALEHDGARAGLLRTAAQAALVVLGVRGHGGVPGLSLGSTSLSVAGNAPCPVVVVPKAPAFPGHGVVVGVDGSPHGQDALAFAVDEAERMGEPLTVVHVWDRLLPFAYTGSDAGLAADPWTAPELGRDEGDHGLLLAEAVTGIAEQHPDLVVQRRLVRHAVPAYALLEQAQHARLLVVGARGRGTVSTFLFGSVSHSVLYTAGVPVAVVPQVGPGRRRAVPSGAAETSRRWAAG